MNSVEKLATKLVALAAETAFTFANGDGLSSFKHLSRPEIEEQALRFQQLYNSTPFLHSEAHRPAWPHPRTKVGVEHRQDPRRCRVLFLRSDLYHPQPSAVREIHVYICVQMRPARP